MRSIYTDPETDKFITELKIKDPEFNLSSFVKVKLLENTSDSESIVDLSNKLEEAKIKQAEAQAEQEYIRQKIAEVELRQNKEQSSLEQEKKRIDYQIKDRKRNFIIYAPELFKLTKKELETYSQEFSMQDVDIKEFLLKKGKVMKSAPREEEDPLNKSKKDNSKLYDNLVKELNI
jgi:hypothetical protein